MKGPAGPDREPDSSDSLLSVASLNLHRGRSRSGQPFDILEACARLDADVIALQEVPGPHAGASAAASAAQQLGYQAHEVRLSGLVDETTGRWVPTSSDRRGHFGLALLTRLPLRTVRAVSLGRARRDPERYAQVAETQMAGTTVRILNTHLTNRLPDTLIQLRRFARLVGASDLPTVAVGDLNIPAWLTQRILGGRPAVRGRSWPDNAAVLQLDHILLHGPVWSVPPGQVMRVGSDHRALRADLRLPGDLSGVTGERSPTKTDAG